MSDQSKSKTGGEHGNGHTDPSLQNHHANDHLVDARMKAEQMEWQEKQAEKKEVEEHIDSEDNKE